MALSRDRHMESIVRPEDSHAPAILELFREYPFRAFQQRRQAIDRDDLARFLYDSASARFGDDAFDHELVMSGTRALGLAGLAPDPWHSEAFGLRMAKVQPFLIYPAPDTAGPLLVRSVLDHARRRGVEHLSCRVDGSDWPAMQLLESEGFYLVDTSQKLTRRLDSLGIDPAPSGFEMGLLREDEEDALATIASRSHDTNHFFNDPALDRSAAKGLFEEWVRKCCRGLARHVFVARRGGREPVGFVTYLGADALEKRLGLKLVILDFIVVSRSCRGRGVGRWLMSESLGALASEYDWVELRTSASNYAALRLYHVFGFETIATDAIFHKAMADHGQADALRGW